MKTIYLLIPLAPLAGAILAGFFGKVIGRAGAHTVTILGVAAAFCLSLLVYQDVEAGNTFNGHVYTWLQSGGLNLEVGFLIDKLTVMMMLWGLGSLPLAVVGVTRSFPVMAIALFVVVAMSFMFWPIPIRLKRSLAMRRDSLRNGSTLAGR